MNRTTRNTDGTWTPRLRIPLDVYDDHWVEVDRVGTRNHSVMVVSDDDASWAGYIAPDFDNHWRPHAAGGFALGDSTDFLTATAAVVDAWHQAQPR